MDVITFIFKRLIDKQKKNKVQKIFNRLIKKRDEVELRWHLRLSIKKINTALQTNIDYLNIFQSVVR